MLIISGDLPGGPLEREPLPLTDEGDLGLLPSEHRYLFAGPGLLAGRGERGKTMPLEFLAADALEPHSMSDMWNGVVVEGQEDDVASALQILEPQVRDVVFPLLAISCG